MTENALTKADGSEHVDDMTKSPSPQPPNSTNMSDHDSGSSALPATNNTTEGKTVLEVSEIDPRQHQTEAWNVKAAAISRQVDHYFSDENLLNDRFLLKRMKGKENLPIPLHIIHGFKKMRIYQSFDDVARAIQERCHLVDIVEDKGKTCVRRKTVYIAKPATITTSATNPKKVQVQAIVSKGKATGFEPNYNDGPRTVAEANDDENDFDPETPLTYRLQSALNRFVKKRRFLAKYLDVFTRFLRFGGIDAGPKMFTGGWSLQELSELSKSELQNLASDKNWIGDDKEELGTVWVVDFEGVAESFISSIVPIYFSFQDAEDLKLTMNVLRSFYNYLRYHDVCPEFDKDIRGALTACDVGEKELLKTQELESLLPGNFNKACSLLYSGYYHARISDDVMWQNATGDGVVNPQGLTVRKAKAAWAIWSVIHEPERISNDRESNLMARQSRSVLTSEDIGLEVTKIEQPSQEVRAAYAQVPGNYAPVGKLHCRLWQPPYFEQNDRPTLNIPEQKTETFTFYIETDVLQHCFIGMKLEGNVRELEGGLQYLDSITAVRCSFYKILPNELLNGTWREPREITREEQQQREARLQGDAEVEDEVE